MYAHTTHIHVDLPLDSPQLIVYIRVLDKLIHMHYSRVGVFLHVTLYSPMIDRVTRLVWLS